MPTTTEDPILDPFRRKLTQNLLKAAAGRAITCPDGTVCGGAILDCRTTVLVTSPSHAGVSCAACFDALIDRFVERTGLPRAAILARVDVDDGRDVFPSRKRRSTAGQ